MPLSNLVYVSIRSPQCSDSDIEAILKCSNHNNSEDNITGVLLYTSNRFIQYLEGSYKSIYGLYEKIKKDNRHSNVILLSLNKDVEGGRLFPSWAMGGKSIDEEVEFISDLNDNEKEAFKNLIHGKVEGSESLIKTIRKVFK